MAKYIMALDQGTTSSRCILFDHSGNMASSAAKEHRQIFPKPGWVEHDPLEIWAMQLSVAHEAMAKIQANARDIAAIGITNQRETTVVWDRLTGKPIHNAIVWQCRRTSDYCDQLKRTGFSDTLKKKTGLVTDAYFSATKLRWLLDNISGARAKAEKGELLFGTVETWLMWNLSGGRIHATDYSNAARTMMYNIHDLKWDDEILEEMEIPVEVLPQVMPSSFAYGFCDKKFFGSNIPITGVAGDQQAALFGQQCFEVGMVKNTYGTGCFILMNTGEKTVNSKNGLLTTIAWGLGDKITYALEGSVFVAGALIKWLRDELRLIDSAEETAEISSIAKNTNGCYIVPAFNGLGAPYWNQHAKGMITGLTGGVNKNHIVRAALESLAYQSFDVIKVMEADCGHKLKQVRVDGGASANEFLMQFQADILNCEVVRPYVIESTALGAAYLAGIECGFYKLGDVATKICNTSNESSTVGLQKTASPNGPKEAKNYSVFEPIMDEKLRSELLDGWKNAVKQVNI